MPRPLLVTPGDPAGIGPEVAVAALRALGQPAILVGEAAAVERWAGPLPRVAAVAPVAGLAVLEPYDLAPRSRGARLSPTRALLRFASPIALEPAGESVELAAVELAARACLDGRARALVTGPIHKGRLAARGHPVRGHTELLGEICGVEPVMAFVGGDLRVALVTRHLPLAEVPGALTAEAIQRTVRVAERALREELGLAAPRVAVCGLNPHAGDEGALGPEERELIGPALAPLTGEIRLVGPISAEAAFLAARRGEVDLVVAMYHDQGLVPLKALDFGRSVNWTLGLPFVRTSVDHGTADDIAGRGLADPAGMIAAIELALRLTAG